MADETFPHLDGERDEEVALAQWQRKRIVELESDVARLERERDGALDLLITRRMERDDARKALRHAEEQLEIERQRTERLRADRDACAQLAEDRLRMLDVATAKVVDLDEATDRALALSEENARLRTEIADLKCPDCAGSGRTWVGEDKDRPATCFACDGRGRR